MFRNYLKTAFRNLGKNKLYSAINIIGLTAALTACLLIGVFITHELSYDKFNKNADRIVRVTMEYKSAETVNSVASTGTKVGPQFKRTFPAVEEYVRTFLSHNTVKTGDKLLTSLAFFMQIPLSSKYFHFTWLKVMPPLHWMLPTRLYLLNRWLRNISVKQVH